MSKAAGKSITSLLQQRRAGVLLHPTSFPGPYCCGDIGHQAYRWVEFMNAAGLSVWQMLPLGPTHADNSPYQCLSVHAANPLLISLDWLADRGWLELSKIELPKTSADFRIAALQLAYQNFVKAKQQDWLDKFLAFKQQHASWLDDYALFVVIKSQHQGKAWTDWPKQYRHRESKALNAFAKKHQPALEQVCFEQFAFFTQWLELKAYANQHNVYLFGDIPIFVSHDSADVWAQRENFLIDADGNASFVAGVPPDYFSEDGQRWGNPLYDWEKMQADGFAWWSHRFETQLELFDLLRIDHFRGLEACWYIPAEEETAINGHWEKTPGAELLKTLITKFKQLPLVAEDLGMITPQVIALRDKFSLPGMKILQFAFDGDPDNFYLPYNQQPLSVVYTGTHDNNTIVGWYLSLDEVTRQRVDDYLSVYGGSSEMPWAMIKQAFASVARLAIIPLQDFLGLDEQHRMNIPGTTENNWLWRYEWHQVPATLASDIKNMLKLCGRLRSE